MISCTMYILRRTIINYQLACLWVESKSKCEVCLAITWIGCDLTEYRNAEGIGYLDVLGRLYREVGHSEAVGIRIEICREWHYA